MSLAQKWFSPFYLLPMICGFCSGAAWQVNLLAQNPERQWLAVSEVFTRSFTVGVAAALLVYLCQLATQSIGSSAFIKPSRFARWRRADMLTTMTLLMPIVGACGVRFDATGLLVMLLVFFFSKLVVAWHYVLGERGEKTAVQWLSIPLIFLCSGFAALIYQVVWQRYLLALLGVNIESVTLVVSVFMVGLGLGALGGGAVTLRYANPKHLLMLFLGCELLIGVCGVVSSRWFLWLEASSGWAGPTLKWAAVGYLIVPTLLMGATLPLMVAYLKQYDLGLGRTVGWLYCGSTLGSALACFVTAHLLFVWLGLQDSLMIAVATNLLVIILVLIVRCRFSKLPWESGYA